MVGIGVLAGAAIGSALVVGLANQDQVAKPSAVSPIKPEAGGGRQAPPLDLQSLAGPGRVSLAAYRGKTVVVNFWSSTCGPCRAEAPELVAFAGAHPTVQMLSVDTTDGTGDGRRFAASAGWTWPIGEMKDGDKGLETWRIAALPQTFVIGPDGAVLWHKLGGTTAAELGSLVKGS